MGFESLGDTARALSAVGSAGGMEQLLPRIADRIRDALPPRSRTRPHCTDALKVRDSCVAIWKYADTDAIMQLVAMQCVGSFAQALRGRWREHAERLIEPMISTGLSDTLVKAFQALHSLSYLVLE